MSQTPVPSSTNPSFEEVIARFLQEEEQGLRPDPQRYLRDHPNLAGDLDAYFRARQGFDQMAVALDPLRPHEAPEAGGSFGDYEILAVLGQGGMGTVYRARQRLPQREVALKVIRGDRLERLGVTLHDEWLARFQREAQLIAALGPHDNLITLYEWGHWRGQAYFTMPLLTGGSLAERLRPHQGESQEAAAARRAREQKHSARLVAQVARGVYHAHQRMVLHRDLKPGNVLIDADGRPIVTDFGLARHLQPQEQVSASGIIGTASYMAPEQARASREAVSVAADVYSLGAILYELLTGSPPFRGDNEMETLLQVLQQQPVPPRALNPRLEGDLETICLKCLEKEPGRRYASAAALADDLENYLASRPINARPVSLAGRARRWCRRNPVLAAAGAVVLATFATAFVLVALSRDRAVHLAAQNGELAEHNGRLAAEQEKLAGANATLAQQRTREADRATTAARQAQRESAMLACQQAQGLCEQGDLAAGLHLFAHTLDLAGRAGAADLEGLCRANLAVWHQHLHSLEHIYDHASGVAAVAVSPDGKTAVTASWDHKLHWWDLSTRRRLGQPVDTRTWVTALAFSGDGKHLATVGAHGAHVWDVASRKIVHEHKSSGTFQALAFAADGSVLLGGTNGQAVLWEVGHNGRVRTLPPVGTIDSVACSSDGLLFATGGYDGTIVLWDARRLEAIGRLLHPGGAAALAFRPDGQVLASAGPDRTVRRWSTRTGQALGNPLLHAGKVLALAFSPDGTLLLSGGEDRTARLWEVDSGRSLGQPLAHPDEVLALAFHPDARTVLTAQGRKQGDARQWRLSVGRPVGRAMAHDASILGLAISPDGTRVATAGRDKFARLWDSATAEPVGEPLPHNLEVNVVAFTPDSKVLLTGSDGNAALVWHATTGKPFVVKGFGGIPMQGGLGHPIGMSSRHLDPFGERPSGERQVVWGPARGKREGRSGLHGAGVHALQFSPDGKGLLSAAGDGIGRLWRPGRYLGPADHTLQIRWEKRTRFGNLAPLPPLYAAAWQPGSALVATGGDEGMIHLWSAATGKEVGKPLPQEGAVMALAFSPDGKRLLSGGADGTARLWDVDTRKPLLPPVRHGGPVIAVAFAPGGKQFLTASWDGAVRLCHGDTGELAVPPMVGRGRLLAAVMSHDGRLILAGGEDRSARLWDSATGRPVGPALEHQDQVRAVALSPSGRLAVSAGDDRVARAWSIPGPMAGSPAQLRLWLEARTGSRRQPDGSVVLLERATWEKARADRQAQQQPADEAEDPGGWHRQQAAAAEAGRRWLEADWHLGRLLAQRPEDSRLLVRRARARTELRQFDAARADLDRAVKLAPADPDALHRRGQLAIRQQRWSEAVTDLTAALAALPRREVRLEGYDVGRQPELLRDRAYARAAEEAWKEAAADLALALRIEGPWLRAGMSSPSVITLFGEHALVCLRLEDRPGHAVACRMLLSSLVDGRRMGHSTIVSGEYGRREVYTFGTAVDPHTRGYMAWVCALGGSDAALTAPALQLAQRAAAAIPRDYALARTLALALLRAGQHERALEQVRAAEKLRTQPSPTLALIEALACQGLKRTDEARQAFRRAERWIKDAKAAKPGDQKAGAILWAELPWTERVALEVLYREAGQKSEKP
jgi:WD40 repeat protein/Flp pilus assembly protein TadD